MSEFSQVTLPTDEIDDLQRQLDGSLRKRIRKIHSGDSCPPPKVSFASTRLTEEDLPAPQPRRVRSSVDSRRGPRLQRSISGLAFDDVGDVEGSSLFGAAGTRDTRAQVGMRSRVEGQMQRNLSLARKRSKRLEYRGWRNVAQERAERRMG